MRAPVICDRLRCSRLGANFDGARFLSPLDSRSQVPAKLVIILPSGKHIFFRLNNSAVPSQHVVLRECESPARWGGANMEIFPKLPRASKRLTEQVGVFAAGATPRPSNEAFRDAKSARVLDDKRILARGARSAALGVGRYVRLHPRST